MGHGLQAGASYTFGKGIDTSSGTTDGDQFQNGLSSLLFFDPATRRGLSDFNIKHTFNVNFTWNLPSPKQLSGVLGWAVRGWELGSILQANTGVPFTPTIGGDPFGLGNTDPFDFPNYVPGCKPIHGGINYLNLNCFALPIVATSLPASLAAQCVPFMNAPPPPASATCTNLVGNAQRNSLVGPGLVNLDFSLFKNNPVKRISDTSNVQFRVEIFNSLNHANFLILQHPTTRFSTEPEPSLAAQALSHPRLRHRDRFNLVSRLFGRYTKRRAAGRHVSAW
jgi:hypothetical protein